jgi:hypothetical protein
MQFLLSVLRKQLFEVPPGLGKTILSKPHQYVQSLQLWLLLTKVSELFIFLIITAVKTSCPSTLHLLLTNGWQMSRNTKKYEPHSCHHLNHGHMCSWSIISIHHHNCSPRDTIDLTKDLFQFMDCHLVSPIAESSTTIIKETCKCAQILHLRDYIPNKSAEKRPKPNCYKNMKKPMLQKQMFTTWRRPKKAIDKRKNDFKTVLYSMIHQNEQITEQASCRKCIPIYFFRCRNLQPVNGGLVCGGHIAQNKDEHSWHSCAHRGSNHIR